jgi:hypothetical protein
MLWRGRLKVKLLNMLPNIEFKKNKSGLWTYIRHQGYHIHFLSSFNSSTKKSYGGYTSQVDTLPITKSQTRSKQNKGMRKCRSVYSEWGVPLPVLTSGGE